MWRSDLSCHLPVPDGYSLFEPSLNSLLEPDMSIAIRQASNAIVTAARLYKELAVSATGLLRPDTYRSNRA